MNATIFDSIKKYITPSTTQTVEPVKGDTLTTFGKVIFILIVIIIFILLINLGMYLVNYWGSSSQNIPIYLISGISNGYTPTTIIQNPKKNPDTYILRSNNRNYGTEFTWSIWLYVKDIVANGNPNSFQNIFNKGNNQYDSITGIATINNAPGLYLSKDTNTLRIIMDTIEPNSNIANNYTDITNIPLGKWFHLAIRLQDRNLDTYVNGIIATRLYLINVPKQNYDTLYVCQNGGFSGNFSDLFYYNYSLPIHEIQTLIMNGPGLVYSKVHIETETSTLSRSKINNYLSPLWYFGENSTPIDLSFNILNPPKLLDTPQTKVVKPEGNKLPKLNTPLNTPLNTDATTDIERSKNNGLIVKPVLEEKATVGFVEKTIKEIIKAIPFSLNSLLFSTDLTDMMSGDVRALDKHNIDCCGNAINTFQYINPGDGTFNYNYMCNNPKGGGMTNLITKSTNFTDTIGSTFDLAKQEVQCPENSVLSQFQLTNNTSLGNEDTATQLQYQYKCLEPNDPSTQPLTCRNINTPSYRMNKDNEYLAKSNITCQANEALSGFKYVLTDNSTKYHYNYTCCKTPYSS
jgi:hypothetical protein